jgi:hypothetical protein
MKRIVLMIIALAVMTGEVENAVIIHDSGPEIVVEMGQVWVMDMKIKE